MEAISHIVIGIFESEFDALAAVDELLSQGLTRHDIHLSDRGNTNRSLLAHKDDNHESRVARFFKTVFSENDDEARKYTRVALESGSVVTAYAHSSAGADKAATILDKNGALDADEFAAQFNDSPQTTGGNKGGKTTFPNATEFAEPLPPVRGISYDENQMDLETRSLQHRSRIIEWKGNGRERPREEQLNETKFW
jgi:hypothetical protein